jgi:hypothetical protein
MRLKNKKILIILFLTLFLLIGYLFDALFPILSLLELALAITIFYLIDKTFKINFKAIHYLLVTLMFIVGVSFSCFYYVYPLYDKILHLINPFLITLIIFYVVDKQPLSLSKKWGITFCILMTFATLHEIGEYLLDTFLGTTTQGAYLIDPDFANKLRPIQSKIDDTMMDIILGAIGSLLFLISIFIKRKTSS